MPFTSRQAQPIAPHSGYGLHVCGPTASWPYKGNFSKARWTTRTWRYLFPQLHWGNLASKISPSLSAEWPAAPQRERYQAHWSVVFVASPKATALNGLGATLCRKTKPAISKEPGLITWLEELESESRLVHGDARPSFAHPCTSGENVPTTLSCGSVHHCNSRQRDG